MLLILIKLGCLYYFEHFGLVRTRSAISTRKRLTELISFIVTAITTVAAYLPVSGGTMSYYGHRNVSESLGFAMGWSVGTP